MFEIKESINKFNKIKKFQNIYISNLDYTTQETVTRCKLLLLMIHYLSFVMTVIH